MTSHPQSVPGATHRALEAALAAAVAASLVLLFHLLGNASNAVAEGRSIFVWQARQWLLAGGDFSHGWIMPLVSLGFVVWRRRLFRAATKSVSLAGLFATAGCLALHVAAMRAQQPRISAMAFVGLTWTMPWALYGGRVARLLFFPCGYLMLAVVSYFLVNITFPMRLFASQASTWMLNGLGIAAERSGTAIFSKAGGGFQFDVADPCSGLRSLVVITALAAPYACLTQKTVARMWVLFVCSIPLAIAANVLRVVTIALVAEGFGREQAMRGYHDWSGFLLFGTACVLLVATDRLINLPLWRRWPPWKDRDSSPTAVS